MSRLFAEGTVDKDAAISADGKYRWWLTRDWRGGPKATFVMLNPSTAGPSLDDPTIRRCMGFAKAWCLGGIRVVNLYALRSTDPKGLWLVDDPVGEENDRHLVDAALVAQVRQAPLIAAWGANARKDRVQHVLGLPFFDRLTALGVTKDGAPRHPLYLRGNSTLTEFPGGAS